MCCVDSFLLCYPPNKASDHAIDHAIEAHFDGIRLKFQRGVEWDWHGVRANQDMRVDKPAGRTRLVFVLSNVAYINDSRQKGGIE